jgi:hypothetical protein
MFAHLAQLGPQIIKPTFEIGSTLPYLGKNYPLRILKEKEPENNIELIDGEFIIKIKSSKESTNKTTMIKKLYEDWLI